MIACLMPLNHYKLYFQVTMEDPCHDTQNIISEEVIERRTEKEREQTRFPTI